MFAERGLASCESQILATNFQLAAAAAAEAEVINPCFAPKTIANRVYLRAENRCCGDTLLTIFAPQHNV